MVRVSVRVIQVAIISCNCEATQTRTIKIKCVTNDITSHLTDTVAAEWQTGSVSVHLGLTVFTQGSYSF